MKNKVLLVLSLITISGSFLYSQTGASPTATELLAHVDNNQIFQTIQYEAEMIIEQETRRGLRRDVKTMIAWARGSTDSFIEFTNREDRGVKYLQTAGSLRYFHPDNERVLPVPAHMLREWMGSDLSFEDVQDNESLSARYTPSLAGTEVINGRPAWILQLTARGTETYPTRRLWIDQENRDLVRYELFALSGAKVQEYNLLRVEVIDGRRFPVEMEIRNLQRGDSRTVFIMRNVVLNRPIADSVFHVDNLLR